MKGRGIVITGAMVIALLLYALVQLVIHLSAYFFEPDQFDFDMTRYYFFVTLGLALAFYLLNLLKKWLDAD